MWSRRDLLRAAGAGAASAIVGGLGCGRRAATAVAPGVQAQPALRPALRDAVARLATRLHEPVAFARVRRRVRAAVDLLEREVWDDVATLVVVAGRDAAGRWRERALDRADPELIRRAADALIADAPAGASTPLAAAAPLDHAPRFADDPADLELGAWQARLDELAARAATGGNSRVVYRAVYAQTDDETRWVITADADQRERAVRSRLGAVAVAWHGSAPVAGTVELAGGHGPTTAALATAALAAANREALALTTPGAFAARADVAVVLTPPVVAAVVARLGPRAAGPAPVIDDPTYPAGFASLAIDDLGRPASRGGPGDGRRRDGDGRLRRAATNLVIAAGTDADLTAAVADGFVVDGALDVGGVGDAVAIRATRVRQLAGGRATGRAWRDVELRGSAAAILAAITAVGTDVTTVVLDDALPRAVIAPSVATRGALVPARGPA